MAKSDDDGRVALDRLDRRLGAFEARRRPVVPGFSGPAGDGYRILGQLLGGVLGGLGLGWAVDHFAHTAPFGIVGGLVIGAGASIWAAVQTASRMSARAEASLPEAAPPPDDEDD